ncbi:MAG: TIGR03790 family protein [Kiritimatiellae bacterium]|nr:TIGR03790 family protein [Kiritimatiellia bacterium]
MKAPASSRGRRAAAWTAAAFAVVLLAGPGRCAEPSPDEVVVLANRKLADSVKLARHYMAARGIPSEHLCLLDLPEDEAITRQQYERLIRNPLLAFLRRAKLIEQEVEPPLAPTTTRASVRYLVSMYGVPVRVTDLKSSIRSKLSEGIEEITQTSAAAVDSELALLLMPPGETAGPVTCPWFNQLARPLSGSRGEFLLVATRLDGPDPDAVRKLIDDGLRAERYGLLGRAYFDSRGMTDSAYLQGDYWLQEAYERFKREGYECVLDRAAVPWNREYPMESPALYFGWYAEHVTGPFTREGFRLRPGAIAYHIHSASAARVRTASQFWVGPLVARGAAATMGAVGEPFLSLTPHLDILADRLCRGYALGDSVYMSLPVVSWQVTVLGDPLYRPFKYPLEEQIRHLEEDEQPDVEWAYLRKVNLLVAEGRFNIALDFCRQKIKESGSTVLREKLGDLYAANDLFVDAARQYDVAVARTASAEAAVRTGLKLKLILRLLDRAEAAEQIDADLRKRWSGSPALDWLRTIDSE